MRKYDISIRDRRISRGLPARVILSHWRGKKKSIFSRPSPCTKKTLAVHVERESCFTSYGHGGYTNKNNPREIPVSLREVCRKLIDLVTCVPTKKPIGDFCFSRWNVIRVWENRSWVYSRSRTGRSLIDNARKGCPEFRKTKRKGEQPSWPSRQSTSSSPSFPLYRPLCLSVCFKRRFSPRASLSFFLHPPFLSVSPRPSTDS